MSYRKDPRVDQAQDMDELLSVARSDYLVGIPVEWREDAEKALRDWLSKAYSLGYDAAQNDVTDGVLGA